MTSWLVAPSKESPRVARYHAPYFCATLFFAADGLPMGGGITGCFY
jgi:hypothetical protein